MNSVINGESGGRREKLPAEVYFIESPTDNTVLVGLNVEIAEDDSGKTVRWFDTAKERMMYADEIKKSDDGKFMFRRAEREGGDEYHFRPMTLDIYERVVKSKLLAPPLTFNSESEMIAAFKLTLE
jgi:hypothetical protein